MMANIRLFLDFIGPIWAERILGFCAGGAVVSVLGAMLLYC